MKMVLDASVGTSWVLPYSLSAQALRLREEYRKQLHELIAPSCFLGEVASALTKAERQKLCQIGEARILFRKVLQTAPAFVPYENLVYRAIDISSQTRSGFWDCVYLALGEQENCEVVTADEKMVRNVQRQFPFVKSLSQRSD